MKKEKRNKYIFILIFVIFISLLIGYTLGTIITIKAIASIAIRFVDIDENLIKEAIFHYENRIADCFPKQNASIYSN